jgi:hypothetical protein
VDSDTLVVQASGRDLRVPSGTYVLEPLALQYLELADALVDPREAVAIRRIDAVGSEVYYVLPVAGPWLILDVAGELRGVRASEHAGGWFVALRDSTDRGALATSFVLADGDTWHGDGWQLRRHPYVEPAGRDWRWRAGRGLGPHSITVVTDDDRELARFWASCAPVPEAGGLDRQHAVAGDRFSIARGQHEDVATDAFDRGVLLALARGDAGDVRWWRAMGHDWGWPYGAGYDGDSLADYLRGDEARVDGEQGRALEPVEVDATGAGTADELARTIAAGLGATDVIDDAHFDQWLARRPISELPRHVHVSVPAAAVRDLLRRLHAAHPFIVWRLSGR